MSTPVTQLWVSRPGKPWPLTVMLAEMRAAREKLAVVSYAFTDPCIAASVIEAESPSKVVILQPSDSGAPIPEALWMLREYFDETPLAPGSGLWTLRAMGGLMHIKAVLTETALFTGSANHTPSSHTRNFELIVRIAEPSIVRYISIYLL